MTDGPEEQHELFPEEGKLTIENCLPEFSILVDDTPAYPKHNREEMYRSLLKLGFQVHAISNRTVRAVPPFPLRYDTVRTTLFKITHPEGWSLSENVKAEMQDCNDWYYILDCQGNQRFLVMCGLDGTPCEAKLLL